MGSLRKRTPAKANTALANAGATGGTGGSPSPEGGATLLTKCTSAVDGDHDTIHAYAAGTA